MPSKSVVVGSAVGLHARPAAIIAEKAAELGSDVTINGVDASSSLMIMTLGAGNGDTVEVLTSKADGAGPSRDWLSFVKSARARNKIKHWFTRERREEMIDNGKEALVKAMRKRTLPVARLSSVESLTGVAEELRLGGIDALYAAIGEGHVSAQHVVARLLAAQGGEEEAMHGDGCSWRR